MISKIKFWFIEIMIWFTKVYYQNLLMDASNTENVLKCLIMIIKMNA